MQSRHLKLLAAATLTAWSLTAGLAQAAGVLTIGCREDSTTFDPIKSAQNRDTWVFDHRRGCRVQPAAYPR